ncbi:MAG: hypothetical protein ACRCZY_00770 [Phocaeicola sp.]
MSKINIDSIEIDSCLKFADISPIVDSIFQVGEKKTIEVTPWHQTEKQEAYYYDFSIEELSDKEDYLEISKKEFLSIMCRWVQLNQEIKKIKEERVGIMDTDKYKKSKEERKSLWTKIEKTFHRASFNEPQADQHEPTTPILPKKLDNDEARKIFEKAIINGYMEVNKQHYKWKQSNVLLAYLIEKLYVKDEASVFPNKAATELFQVKNLKQSQHQYINNKEGKPKGHKLIDDLFTDM